MSDISKVIISFLAIVIFYYIVNFILFDIKNYGELDYYICFFIGLVPYMFFKFIKEQTGEDIYEYGAKLTLLVVAVWYISYGMVIEQTFLKVYAIAILLIVSVFLDVMTKGNWPYKTDEGQYFKINNLMYCFCLGLINWGAMAIALYVLVVGEWGV